MSAENQQPLGCDFQAPVFGASYPDGQCIEGYLWDLDSCEEPGGPLTSGGDEPCPKCNHGEWLESARDEWHEQGWIAREEGQPRKYDHKRIAYEQDGDANALETAWVAGWDERENELKGEK